MPIKTAFVTAEFRTAGRKISADAVQSLVYAVGASLAGLAAACSQLIADASGPVTAELVDHYYGGRIEATAFKVADAQVKRTLTGSRLRCGARRRGYRHVRTRELKTRALEQPRVRSTRLG